MRAHVNALTSASKNAVIVPEIVHRRDLIKSILRRALLEFIEFRLEFLRMISLQRALDSSNQLDVFLCDFLLRQRSVLLQACAFAFLCFLCFLRLRSRNRLRRRRRRRLYSCARVSARRESGSLDLVGRALDRARQALNEKL
jgi:hypothetical protein